MPKPKTSPDLTPKPYRLLKSDIAAKLSARSTGGITYVLLADTGDEPELHIAVTANEGGGLWSKEAVALNTIETVLDAYPWSRGCTCTWRMTKPPRYWSRALPRLGRRCCWWGERCKLLIKIMRQNEQHTVSEITQ